MWLPLLRRSSLIGFLQSYIPTGGDKTALVLRDLRSKLDLRWSSMGPGIDLWKSLTRGWSSTRNSTKRQVWDSQVPVLPRIRLEIGYPVSESRALSVNLARPLKEGQSDAIGSQGQDVTANYDPGEPEILRCCPLQSSILALGEV
jgi:hypothetical protein